MDNLRMINWRPLFCGLVACLIFVSSAGAGESGSIGIQVVPISTGELSVLHIIAGSPAQQNGLLPGDLIIDVDGKPMKGSDFDLVTREYLWGEVGSTVSLTWLRPGVAGKKQAKIERVEIVNNIKVKPTPGVNLRLPN